MGVGERHPRPQRGLLSRPSLEQVLGLRLPLGALVMVTDANSFVTLPLESNATLTAASALWDLNEALRRQRPEPLPPRLLWVRGWAVHDLGAGVVDGQFTVELPGELRAALAQLN